MPVEGKGRHLHSLPAFPACDRSSLGQLTAMSAASALTSWQFTSAHLAAGFGLVASNQIDSKPLNRSAKGDTQPGSSSCRRRNASDVEHLAGADAGLAFPTARVNLGRNADLPFYHGGSSPPTHKHATMPAEARPCGPSSREMFSCHMATRNVLFVCVCVYVMRLSMGDVYIYKYI